MIRESLSSQLEMNKVCAYSALKLQWAMQIQGVAYIEMGLTVVEIAQLGSYITLRNAKIDMYRGSMRLAVDQWGKVEESDVKDYEPKVKYGNMLANWHLTHVLVVNWRVCLQVDNNLSLIEYELVTVPTEAAA